MPRRLAPVFPPGSDRSKCRHIGRTRTDIASPQYSSRTHERPKFRLRPQATIAMSFADRIFNQQHITSPDDALCAVTHFDFGLPDHEEDILSLRRGMPADKRGFVAQLLTLLKDQSIRLNGTRIIRVVPSFDHIFLMIIEMRLFILICKNTRDLHNSTYPAKFHANLSLT